MTVVGEAWVKIRADGKAFPAETRAATQGGMAEMEAQSAIGGRRAGTRAGREFAGGSETALRGERGRFTAAGENIGGGLASGVGGGARRGEEAVAGSAGRMGRDLEKTGGHVSKLGILSQLGFGRVASAGAMGAAGIAVGAAVAIGASVKMASTFQESTTQLVTGAGESGKAIGMVREGLLNMAGQVGVSANDLAKGMYQVESAGFHGAQGLNVMKIAAEGAKVGGADMATVTDAITTGLNAYHLPASKAASVTNDLIATVAHGKTHLQDLASSLGAVLPISAALHVKLPEVTGAMATMTTQGTSASKAATSLRFLMGALVNPSGKAADALASVGLSGDKVSNTLTHHGLHAALQLVTDAVGKKFPVGSAAYTAAIADIVGGTRGMTAALELTGKHSADFTKNVHAIGKAASDTSGKVHGWARVQDDFGTQMSRVGAALGAFFIKIGTVLLPPLTAAAKWLANFITWIGDRVGPVLKKAGDFLGGIGSALGKLFGGGGDKKASGIAKGFDAVTKAANGVGDGVKYAGRTAMAFGTLLAGAAKVARGVWGVLVAWFKGVVSVWKALWDGLVRIVRKVFDTIRQYLADHKEAVHRTFAAVGAALKVVAGAFKAAFDFIRAVVKVVIGVITGLWDRFGKHLVGHIHTELNAVIQVFKGVFTIIRGIFDFFAGIFTGKWGRVWKGIKEIASGIWNIIIGLFKHFVNYLSLILGAAMAVISFIWSKAWKFTKWIFGEIWHGILWIAKTVWHAIASFFSDRLHEFVGFWVGVWNTVKRWFTAAWNGIKAVAKIIWNAISGFFTGAFHAFVNFWVNWWTTIKHRFGVVWDAIKAVAKTIWNAIADFFVGAFHRFVAFWTDRWNNVKHFFGVVWDAIKSIAKTVWGAIASFFVGAFHRFVAFWTDRWNNIKHFFGQAWDDIKGIAKTVWGAISGFFHAAVHTFAGWWSGIWNTIKKTFGDVWGGIKRIATDVWGGIKSAVRAGINDIIGVINIFIRALDLIPFVSKVLHPIGKLAGGGIATAGGGRGGGGVAGGFRAAAGGGVLPGYAPGVDSIPYMLSPGEGVLVPEAVRALGPSWVHAVNRSYAPGRANPAAHGGVQYAAAGVGAGVALEGRAKGWSKDRQKKQLADILAHHADGASLMQLLIQPLAQVALSAVSGLGSLLGGGPVLPDIAKSAIAAIGQNAKDAASPIWEGGGSNAQRNAILAYAKKFIGTPYVWGGAEPGGFDCSGFTSFVLDHFKINTPRTAHEQQAWTKNESKAAAMPADLIFYGNPAHHVGFWLGGDKYLDAPHTGASIAIQPIYDSPNWGAVPGLSRASTSGGAVAAHGAGGAANRALGMRLARAQGLDFGAIDYIFSHESGWDNTAQSPDSTAYGIAQFEDMTWPQYGPKTSDPWHQIEYGFKYMNDRYDGPDGAAAYWRVHHNYDTGGWLQPGLNAAVNGTGRREAVMPEDIMVAAIERSQNPAALLKAVDELADYAAQIRDLMQGAGGGGQYRGVTSG